MLEIKSEKSIEYALVMLNDLANKQITLLQNLY
jgi:hypothetical protein